jgi:hypothetical protein
MLEEKKQDPQDSTAPENGKVVENQNGNPTVEDLKNLQKSVSEKDRLLKETEAKLAEFQKAKDSNTSETEKLIASLKEEIGGVRKEMETLNIEKRRESLATKFPDILPELLIGKTDEEIGKIVENQRALSKKLYGDSEYFRQPTYRDEADVDKAIDAEIKDTKKSGIDTALNVLRLNRLKK